MSGAPGAPRTIAIYWFLIGGLLMPMTVLYGALMLPSLGGVYVFSPEALDYALYAAMGWIVLYTIDTIDILRYVDLESLAEEFQEWLMLFGRGFKLGIALLIVAYLNAVVLFGVAGGLAVERYLGLPAAGLIVALLYPGLDFHYAFFGRETPGKLFLRGVLGIFHAFGILRDITASGILSGILPSTPQ